MNRDRYFEYISEKLHTLASRIQTGGKLNMLNLHHHSENFYRDFFNILYQWKSSNLNSEKQNIEAIDLVCDSNKLVIQISATCTKAKIESALAKRKISEYPSYRFKFISLSHSADKLREETFTNPFNIKFLPKEDIYDIDSVLKDINDLDIDHLTQVQEFIKKELGNDVMPERFDSNLAEIVNILSKENLESDGTIEIDGFAIDRKISFNKLVLAKRIIDDFNIHQGRLDRIYSEFDLQGVNKSSSVLATIRLEYQRNIGIKNEDELFIKIIDNVREKVLASQNFIKIPIDELEICVNILVVDAFIRCKIFEHPGIK